MAGFEGKGIALTVDVGNGISDKVGVILQHQFCKMRIFHADDERASVFHADGRHFAEPVIEEMNISPLEPFRGDLPETCQ